MSNLVLFIEACVILLCFSLLFYQGKLARTLKFAVIVPLVTIMMTVASTMDSYKGWPSEASLPQGRLIAAEVRNPSVRHDGQIYVWMYVDKREEMWYSFVFYSKEDVPQAYELPYSKEAAEEMTKAKQALKAGAEVKIGGPKSPELSDEVNPLPYGVIIKVPGQEPKQQ